MMKNSVLLILVSFFVCSITFAQEMKALFPVDKPSIIDNYLKEEWVSLSDGTYDEDTPDPIVNGGLLFFSSSVYDLENGKMLDLSLPGNRVVAKQKCPDSLYMYDSRGVKIKNIHTGQIVASFFAPYYGNRSFSIIKTETVLVTELKRILVYNVKTKKIIWEKPFVKDIRFSSECADGYLVQLESQDGNAEHNCFLLDKTSGKVKWSGFINGRIIRNDQNKKSNRLYCITLEVKYKANGLPHGNSPRFVNYIDTQKGTLVKVAKGEDIFIDKNDLYIFNGEMTYRLDEATHAVKDSMFLEGNIYGAFNNYIICENDISFYLYRKNGEPVAKGIELMKSYINIIPPSDEEAEGFTPFRIFFIPENGQRLIGLGSEGDIICFKILSK